MFKLTFQLIISGCYKKSETQIMLNISNFSCYNNCSRTSPKCQEISPGNITGWFELPMPWVRDGIEYKRQRYLYNNCLSGSAAYHFNKEGNYHICFCVQDPYNDCQGYFAMDDENLCKPIFIKIISIQMIVLIIGIISNAIIACSFCRKREMQVKNSNILFFNQSLADMANCLIYTLPNVVHLMYQFINEDDLLNMAEFNVSFVILTVSSSILLYLIIAIERCLSIYRPLWHRAHLRREHLWKAVCVAWSLTLVVTIVPLCILFSLPVSGSERWMIFAYYEFALIVILLLLVAFITIVLLASFVKALQSVMIHPGQPVQDNLYGKKHLKMISTFIIMYFAFLMTFVPVVVAARNGTPHHSAYNQTAITVFTSTSVVNAFLTMYLKKDFRFTSQRVEPDAAE